MKKHEGRMGGRIRHRARLAATAGALVSALALAAPAVAGAATYPSYTRSITITQNTSMIVDVSTLNATIYAAVSWSDVSWSDVY